MRGARRALLGAAAAAAVTSVAGAAGAWFKDEHQAIVSTAYRLACIDYANTLDACNHDAPGGVYDDHVAIAGQAAHDADACHSFWFSETGIAVNGDRATERASCAIVDGVGYTDPSPWIFFGENLYFFKTNTNHFGAHAMAHAKYWQSLALEAAHRYAAAPAAAKNQCSRAAIGLAGFADHYMTDRTAAGHAFTPDPHAMSIASVDDKMVGLLGCLHGQTAFKRAVVSLGTGFDCMDGAWFTSEPVWDGFGRSGRWFGDAFYGDDRQWRSDYDWSTTVTDPSKGSALQRSETLGSAVSVFQTVLATMVGGKADLRVTDTYESNFESCRVLWGECCRSYTADKGPNGGWDDPEIQIQAHCDYCAPDVTDDALKAMCPAKQIRLHRQDDGGIWKTVYGDSVWNAYHGWPRTGAPWTGTYYYEVELDRPVGDWSGTDVARTLMAKDMDLIHPDARWDAENDVVTLLGCDWPGRAH